MQMFARPSVLNTVGKIHRSITNLSDDILVELLLYGSKKLQPYNIITTSITFTKNSERFFGPLF